MQVVDIYKQGGQGGKQNVQNVVQIHLSRRYHTNQLWNYTFFKYFVCLLNRERQMRKVGERVLKKQWVKFEPMLAEVHRTCAPEVAA